MSEPIDLSQRIEALSELLREKTGASGGTFTAQMRKARHRLPRPVVRQAQIIAETEALLDNPRLSRTIDGPRFDAASAALTAHLESIDLADRRKGWWLGMLGGMAFNLLAALVLFIAALRFLGLI